MVSRRRGMDINVSSYLNSFILCQDTHRLPEGIVRIAYDADTRQYTFRDTTTGRLYRSAPGERYGTLHPVLDHLPSRPNAFAPEGCRKFSSHSLGKCLPVPTCVWIDRPRSRSAAQNTTFHDILPAHAIAKAPTGTSSSSSIGSRLLTSARGHSRSQSTRVPSSSQSANNSLHSRSKSVSDRPGTHEREHRSTHSHRHDRRHQSHHHRVQSETPPSHQLHRPPQTSSKGAKSGFSLLSALRNLSRSLTTVRARRSTTPAQEHSENDRNHTYRRL